MSTIGSVGGSSSELMAQMLQQLTAQNQSTQASSARGSPPQGGGPPPGPPPGGAGMITDKVGEFAEEAGLDAETVAALQDELDSAISTALENKDHSNDPKEVIDSAIASTFEEYGLDSDAFLSDLQESMPAGGPGMGGTGGQLPTSDMVSQMFTMMSTGTFSTGTSAGLLEALA